MMKDVKSHDDVGSNHTRNYSASDNGPIPASEHQDHIIEINKINLAAPDNPKLFIPPAKPQ